MSENTNLTTTDEETSDRLAKLEQAEIITNGDNEVRDFDVASSDHPLVEYAGERAMQTDSFGGGDFISETIYSSNDAWTREWLQNAESANIAAAKLLIRLSDKYPDGWLQQEIWVHKETGETVVEAGEKQSTLAECTDTESKHLRKIEIPRPIEQVLEAAKSLGYEPTIVWDVYRDERKIVTEDNGIGMTPREFIEAFEKPFQSASGVDSITGGQFGVGSESVSIVYGDEGGAEVTTHSRRPGDHNGFKAYTYSGGATAIPGDVDDDFRGTRFTIPVCEEYDLSQQQERIEKYAEGLRVPLLYREHNSGETTVEEEYEATEFVNNYDDAPVVVERPGEFSVVAGPNIIDTSYRSSDPDTFLVSMPIDRNNSNRISTMWDVVIQIHDEQGRIVMGPNRGKYREEVDDLHEEDVILPEPTGDRDRLQKDSHSKQFFQYIEEVVTSEELKQLEEIAKAMKAADHPSEAINENKEAWELFSKAVSYHGGYNVKSRKSNFESFLNDSDELPKFDSETVEQIYNLFNSVERCTSGPNHSTKKGYRSECQIGNLLSLHDVEQVYMAVSTSGKFTERFKVARNSHESIEVVVISGANQYQKYSSLFGWKKLKDVPLTQSDEHDFDVPTGIHDENKRTSSSGSRGKSDNIEERTLKFRCDSSDYSIDERLTIEETKEKLDENRLIGCQRYIILFPRTLEKNISDNYGMAKYAAIASVSKTEYEQLEEYDRVFLPEEFKQWSRSALIATEDGAKTPEELTEDGEMIVLGYKADRTFGFDLMKPENKELRELVKQDIHDQHDWPRYLDGYDGGYGGDNIEDIADEDLWDVTYAVADSRVLRRAQFAFDELNTRGPQIVCLKLKGVRFARNEPCKWTSLNKSIGKYRTKVETPNWDNDSDVYSELPKNRGGSSMKRQLLLGLHDRGIDPTNHDEQELRDIISGEND